MRIVGIHLEPGGVGWLRCWNWTTALKARGHDIKHRPHEATQFEWGELDDYLRGADVVITCRMSNAQVFAALMAGRKLYGYKLIVDTDDHSDDLPIYNPAHKDYHPGAGVNRLSRGEFREADLVTVSTQSLATWVGQYAKKVVVQPNCVDLSMYKDVRSRQKEERHRGDFRIYWGGGGGHYGDLAIVKDAMLRIVKEHPNVKLVFSNILPDWAADLPSTRAHFIRFAHWNAYPKVLKWLCADVAISPLVDNEFNRCKSNIKYLTYAMADLPCVYSDITAYDSVQAGVTGLKATSSQDWYETLSLLISNPGYRDELAANAKADVLANWTIDNHINGYEKMLEQLVESKTPEPIELSYLREGKSVEAVTCLMS